MCPYRACRTARKRGRLAHVRHDLIERIALRLLHGECGDGQRKPSKTHAARSFLNHLSTPLILFLALSSGFQRSPEALSKFGHRHLRDSVTAKCPRFRVKNRCRRGILRHPLASRPRIPRDAESALCPAQHAKRFSPLSPEEEIGLFAPMEARRTVHVRLDVSNAAPGQAPRGERSEQPFFRVLDCKARLRPDFSIFPMTLQI